MKKPGKRFVCFLLIFTAFISSTSTLVSCAKLREIGASIKDGANDVVDTTLSKSKQIIEKIKESAVDVYDVVRDEAIYVYDKAANFVSDGYETVSDKVNEIIGDVDEFITDLNGNYEPQPVEFFEADTNRLVKDKFADVFIDNFDSIQIGKEYLTEKFVPYYISSVLSKRGFDVYSGCVYYKGKIFGGLIFTSGDFFIDDEGQLVYSCGFVQLVSDDYSGEIVTEEMVNTGLVAVVSESTDKLFVVDEYTRIDDFSGIYNGIYFKYHQIGDYAIHVTLQDNDSINYDSSISLFDFDNQEYIYLNENQETDKQYKDVAIKGATDTVNAIVEIGENSDNDIASIITFDQDALDILLKKAEDGAENVAEFFTSTVQKLEVVGNRFVSIGCDGIAEVLGSDHVENYEKTTDALFETIATGVNTGGAIVSAVIIAREGTLIVSSIIVTVGATVVVYGISEMIESVQDIYYGVKGGTNSKINPIRAVLKSEIHNDDIADFIYHCWGVSSKLIGGALNIQKNVIRLTLCAGIKAYFAGVKLIKTSISIISKAFSYAKHLKNSFIYNYVANVTEKVKYDEYLGGLKGIGKSLVATVPCFIPLRHENNQNSANQIVDEFEKAIEHRELYVKECYHTIRSMKEDEVISYYLAGVVCSGCNLSDIPDIYLYYDSTSPICGYCEANKNSIYINMRSSANMTVSGLTDTVAHEIRHIWQYLNVENQSELYDSYQNIILPESDYSNFDEYSNQICEQDARDFSKNIIVPQVDMIAQK